MFRVGTLMMKTEPFSTSELNDGNPVILFGVEEIKKTLFWVEAEWGLKHLPNLGRVVYFTEGSDPVFDNSSLNGIWVLEAKNLKVIEKGRKSKKGVSDLRYRH